MSTKSRVANIEVIATGVLAESVYVIRMYGSVRGLGCLTLVRP